MSSPTARLAGAPEDRVQLITNAFILPDMMAKAVTGTSDQGLDRLGRQPR